MISPRAYHLLIRHLDAIDRAVTRRAMRKRPWLEVAFTSLLCEMMDEETQPDAVLPYTVEQLNDDLRAIDGLLSVRLSIDTHEYPPNVERWVTQSDIGIVLQFRDYIVPHESWETASLLQAKRIEPDSRVPLKYSDLSRSRSLDSSQTERMEQLDAFVGGDFVKFLFYAPRPEDLDEVSKLKLLRLRQLQLAGDIFDFTSGLEIRDEVSKADSTLSAGLWVASLDASAFSLGEIHGSAFDETKPFSWFIADHFAPSRHRAMLRSRPAEMDSNQDLRIGIVRGDSDAIGQVLSETDGAADGAFQFIPAHVLTVEIGVGERVDREAREAE